MKCLKMILHRPQIYLGFCALLLSVFLSFGLSQDSYATSSTCTINFSNSGSGSLFNLKNLCGFTSGSYYFKFDSYDLTFTGTTGASNSSVYFRLGNPNTDSQYAFLRFFIYNITTGSTFSFSNDSVPVMISQNFYLGTNYSSNNQSLSYSQDDFRLVFYGSYLTVSGSITLSYSSDISDLTGGSSTSCPDPEPCPPIPENPYDQKLDDIKKAILTCAATALAIYLFFCLYNIIVKNGGKR